MSKPQEKVVANLMTQRQRDLPLEPLTRLVNLAAVAVGVLRSKSLQRGQIVTALPLDGTRDPRKQRGQRFVKNPGVRVEGYAEPGARRILQRLVAGGARIQVPVDRTEGGNFNLLYVCGGWRGRAVPRLWTPLEPGASSVAEQPARLTVVAGGLPAQAEVLLLGDRACGTGVLAQWALQQGWGLCLRLRAHEYVGRAGAPYCERLPLVLLGERRFGSHGAVTQTGYEVRFL
jgi:hypothetical protein